MQISDCVKTTEILYRLFNEKALTIANCVHLAIDVQYDFISGKQTIAAADNIVEHIAPSFNKMNIPTCWIYFDTCGSPVKAGHAPLYKVRRILDGDWLMPKQTCSAFYETDLRKTLEATDKKLLFITGFTRMICVKDTIRDGITSKFNIVLVEDGTNPADDMIEDAPGTITAYSKDIFSYLEGLNKN